MSTSSWLAFLPRDTVFVRDGRPFDAASDALAQTVWPGPTTIAGAVGAAFGGNPDEVRGPVLARRGRSGWEPYFRAPADLVVTQDRDRPRRVFRLTPAEPAGQTDLHETAASRTGGSALRLLVPAGDAEFAGPVEPLRGWIPGHVLAEYLAGRLPAPEGTPLRGFEPLMRGEELAEPLLPERRVGLAREDRSARAGYLYQAAHLRPDGDWAFLAEITAPAGWSRPAADHIPFGGRGRLADVRPAALRWPASGVGEDETRVLVYLATPAVWPDGWRMPVPDGAGLAAAASGDPEPAATVKREQGRAWRDSRALRWAVPAGSVYLLEFGDGEAGAAWARTWHGTALDRGGTPPDEDLLRTAGFGVVLTGAWT
ncbi:MAG TPA: type III-B CRISPR module-associated Cmr3 family protein [Streptosporangiaceae bacterium]|nr:type III-B CRISPR module-associated Cmr3 family protein [Streptosporangiaceae bacterium]